MTHEVMVQGSRTSNTNPQLPHHASNLVITEVTHRVTTWVVSRSATAPFRCAFVPLSTLGCSFPMPCCRRVCVVSHHCRLPNLVVAPSSRLLMMRRLFPLLLGRFPSNIFLTILYHG